MSRTGIFTTATVVGCVAALVFAFSDTPNKAEKPTGVEGSTEENATCEEQIAIAILTPKDLPEGWSERVENRSSIFTHTATGTELVQTTVYREQGLKAFLVAQMAADTESIEVVHTQPVATSRIGTSYDNFGFYSFTTSLGGEHTETTVIAKINKDVPFALLFRVTVSKGTVSSEMVEHMLGIVMSSDIERDTESD